MTYDDLWRPLTALYEPGEAKAIVRLLLDERFSLSATDIYCGKVTHLSADDCALLGEMLHRLLRAEPVQYVLGRASFCGRPFGVGPGVLIPRPETEELCRWIADKTTVPAPDVLDVGTGSGCIAVSLALDIPGAHVSAWDISAEALTIARGNAAALSADVTFALQDALHPPHDTALWDVVVSNPPYICRRERAAMHRNVLDYEPSSALFVPDDDPLLFYRAIALYARQALRQGGRLYFEINPLFADDMAAMLHGMGYGGIEVRDDGYGKRRFVRGQAPEPPDKE